jgi:serine/threonine-protein kinase
MSDDPIHRLNSALEGRYRIEHQLGEGGMATVYLAHDLRHQRKVALKVLRPEVAAVIGSGRFLAEIRTTANLQHPHILPLFDSGEADSFLYYVMPYVEGESMRARLDREQQLPLDEAVRIAKDVAEALDYAHSRGVVHRDIKPANVLLQAGQTVVADFGIALALGAAGGGRATRTGVTLGTPQYMSPEQAAGDSNVGAQSDIYALGCVLYEMLVGEPPFTGRTPQAVLGMIVTGEPRPVRDRRKATPENVEAAVTRALEKLPADRFLSGAEFALALDDAGFRHPVPAKLGAPGGSARRLLPGPSFVGAVTLAALAGAIGAGIVLTPGGDDAVPIVRFAVPVADVEGIYLGGQNDTQNGRPVSTSLAISPSGDLLVYAARAQESNGSPRSQLYSRRWEHAWGTPIPGTGGASSPFFSPDGAWIGHFVGTSLMRVPVGGGSPQTIATDVQIPGSGPRGATWGDDGTIIFGGLGGLYQVAATGGDPVLVADVNAPPNEFFRFGQPQLLAGSRSVMFHAKRSTDPESADIVALDLVTGELSTLLTNGMDPQSVHTGHLLFMRMGTLMAAPFDVARLELEGEPVTVMDDVMHAVGMTNSAWDTGAGQVAISQSGHLAYAPGGVMPEAARAVVRVSLDGEAEDLGLDPRGFMSVRVSPDGDHLALYANTGRGRSLFIHDLTRGVTTRLNTGAYRNLWPVWGPDGGFVAYTSDLEGVDNAYRIRADGSGSPERLAPSERGQIVASWSAADVIAYQQGGNIWVLPPEGSAVPFFTSEANERFASFSPDGSLLAYVSDESGVDQVYVRPYPGPGGPTQVSSEASRAPAWSPDGNRIYYQLNAVPSKMMAVDVVSTEPFHPGPPVPIIDPWPYFSTVLVTGHDMLSDGSFVTIEAHDPEDARGNGAREVHVVLNFVAELRRRVPG